MKLIYGYKNFIIFTLFNLFYLFSLNFINKNNNYNFLIWNLFLGFVPYLLAIVLHYYSNRINNITLLFGSFLWLGFYPNAPYMITDLIHVNENSSNVIYEALMIFSFSMESLFFGFYSVKIMEFILIPKRGKLQTNVFLVTSLFLSSFGIYLGRILRLNTWDIFTAPSKTFELILNHLFPITQNPTTYSMILLFTFIQFILYIQTNRFHEE